MLKGARKAGILDLLEQHDYLTVTEIAESLDVSAMTVRRDVNEMAKENSIIRVYGGVKKIDRKVERTTNAKLLLNVAEKTYIGKVMNSLIKDHDRIYIGAGTTMFYALSNITHKGLYIVTNSLLAFEYLVENTDHEVVLTGGSYNKATSEFLGTQAENSLADLNFDVAFFATNGIIDNLITTSSIPESEIQRKVYRHTKLAVVVADSSKFGIADRVTFTVTNDIDYILTDTKLSPENYQAYNKQAHPQVLTKPLPA